VDQGPVFWWAIYGVAGWPAAGPRWDGAGMLPDQVFYIEPPTVAPGLTIDEYRRSRPRRRRWWARFV